MLHWENVFTRTSAWNFRGNYSKVSKKLHEKPVNVQLFVFVWVSTPSESVCGSVWELKALTLFSPSCERTRVQVIRFLWCCTQSYFCSGEGFDFFNRKSDSNPGRLSEKRRCFLCVMSSSSCTLSLVRLIFVMDAPLAPRKKSQRKKSWFKKMSKHFLKTLKILLNLT